MKNTIKDMPMQSALSILQGNYVGIDIATRRFGLCAAVPKKFLQGGKSVLIDFFPEYSTELKGAYYGLKKAVSDMAIHMCGGEYIPFAMYKNVVSLAAECEASANAIVDKIAKESAALKKDYQKRVKEALENEGITDEKAKKEATDRMMSKWPTKFEVEFSVNAYAFPTPGDEKISGVSPEIQAAMSTGNNLRIIKAMSAVVGNVYNELFTTAAAVASSMEKGGYLGIASRTKAKVNKTSEKAREFMNTICQGGKISMGDTVEAIKTFDKVFVDGIEDITPTTARMYAAVLYNSAVKLGIEDELDISRVGVDVEEMEAVDWQFGDF